MNLQEALQKALSQPNLWKPTPVTETPSLMLRSWKIYECSSPEVERATRHLVGYNITEREGRVSSEIKEFQQSRDGTLMFVTDSGRRYGVMGPPGVDGDAEYVFAHWKRIFKIDKTKDVTHEYHDAQRSESNS